MGQRGKCEEFCLNYRRFPPNLVEGLAVDLERTPWHLVQLCITARWGLLDWWSHRPLQILRKRFCMKFPPPLATTPPPDAHTVGSHVTFGVGKYMQSWTGGRRLIFLGSILALSAAPTDISASLVGSFVIALTRIRSSPAIALSALETH